jgi:acyl carrier protein
MSTSEWLPMAALALALASPLVYLGIYVARRRLRAARLLASREPLDERAFARQFFLESTRRYEIARGVREVLGRHYPLPLEGLRPGDEFIKDLRMDDFDSLATVEVVLDLEQQYGVKLPEERLASARTFRELVDIVEEALEKAS